MAKPSYATPAESIWNDIFTDLFHKYAAKNDITALCSTAPAADCLSRFLALPYSQRSSLTMFQCFQQIVLLNNPELAAAAPMDEQTKIISAALAWLRRKYGILPQPVLTALRPGSEGSYRTGGRHNYQLMPPQLPAIFEPQLPSSLQDLDSYIHRKWGGLEHVATADNILFSELGTQDTMQALQRQGFHEFYAVNGPYAMRGSKTMLAYRPGMAHPKLVLYSFINRELFKHKLMQLAFEFGDSFKNIQILTAQNLKSWEVGNLVVERALRLLPQEPAIDDLVVGYSDSIEKILSADGVFLKSVDIIVPEGVLATLKYYSVTAKSGIMRTVALLTNVEMRYFGSSVLR